MRIRRRTYATSTESWSGGNLSQIDLHCDNSTHATTQSFAPYSNKITGLTDEFMADGLGKGVPHSVFHRRLGWSLGTYRGDQVRHKVNPPYGRTTYVGSGQYWPVTFEAISATERAWDVTNTPPGPLPPPRWNMLFTSVNEASLKEDVIEKASQLKADILLNAVEANQAWPAVKSLAMSLPNIAANWKNIRKVIKTASSAYLAWKFGISPIIGDMMSVRSHLPKLADDVKRHTKQDAFRYSKVAECVAEYNSIHTGNPVVNGYTVRTTTSQGRVVKPPTIRYVLVAKPNTKYVSDFFKNLDYFMSRFATSPANFAWEKTPFSFVADWFVDLRSTLRSVDNMLGFSPYTVVSFTRSYSYHVETDIFNSFYSSCNGSMINSLPACTVSYKHYDRSQMSMAAKLPFMNVKFGKNQAGISAALIAQMLIKT